MKAAAELPKKSLLNRSNMSKRSILLTGFLMLIFVPLAETMAAFAQSTNGKNKTETERSIGGKEHEANIYGVTIGMDVPTALKTVFANADRKPGQEKPDAKKREGKDKKDIRVLYENLPAGKLQILFADGKIVKEIVLTYANPPLIDDLRLPFTGSLGNGTSLITTQSSDPRSLSQRTDTLNGTKDIDLYNASNVGNTSRGRGEALDGTRFDDRYSVAFVDNQRLQRIWLRDDKLKEGYRIRIEFISEKKTKAGASFVARAAQKVVLLLPEDEMAFRRAFNL